MVGREVAEHVPVGLKIVREPSHVGRAKYLGKDALRDQAILERVARARRRLRAIRDYPPLPVGRSCEIGAVVVQVNSVWRRHVAAGAQKIRMTKYQLGRKDPVAQQTLRAIDVCEN